MRTGKKNKSLNPGQLVAAIVFVVVMFGLVLFAAYYDPQRPFSNGFFEDVSNAVQWR